NRLVIKRPIKISSKRFHDPGTKQRHVGRAWVALGLVPDPPAGRADARTTAGSGGQWPRSNRSGRDPREPGLAVRRPVAAPGKKWAGPDVFRAAASHGTATRRPAIAARAVGVIIVPEERCFVSNPFPRPEKEVSHGTAQREEGTQDHVGPRAGAEAQAPGH